MSESSVAGSASAVDRVRAITEPEWDVVRKMRERAATELRTPPAELFVADSMASWVCYGDCILAHEFAEIMLPTSIGKPVYMPAQAPRWGVDQYTVVEADARLYLATSLALRAERVAPLRTYMPNAYVGRSATVHGSVGADCVIGPYAAVLGSVSSGSIVGADCVIDSDSYVVGTRLGSGCVVGPNSGIQRVEVDSGATIAPNCSLACCDVRCSVICSACVECEPGSDDNQPKEGILEPDQIMAIDGIGSRLARLSFFVRARPNTDRLVLVNTGCFNGDIHKFVAAVRETHASKHGGKRPRIYTEYMDAVQFALKRFRDAGYEVPTFDSLMT